jgi:hypothetical protein
MPEPTDADRARALALLEKITFGGYGQDSTVEMTAQALADERERARAPFLDLADFLAQPPLSERKTGRISTRTAAFQDAAEMIRAQARDAQEDPK